MNIEKWYTESMIYVYVEVEERVQGGKRTMQEDWQVAVERRGKKGKEIQQVSQHDERREGWGRVRGRKKISCNEFIMYF